LGDWIRTKLGKVGHCETFCDMGCGVMVRVVCGAMVVVWGGVVNAVAGMGALVVWISADLGAVVALV